ncbi:ester cyclase [Chitinophaga nivalis]|uniref:Ester cyclase n=1 Tax=Chitinophaga nivalis TaxID=2991709 RepID=A0ABT3IH44_9BACT|nr:ester cyclase [Chitinophaga nivalis]MCW3467051.1 ester cyclase [Chitinophaga nivalis]MCW3483258.1 ester cyclase [Chitinophaga nivalis]
MPSKHIIIASIAALLVPGIAASQSHHTKKNTIMHTTPDNKSIIRELYSNTLNKHDLTGLPAIISDEYTGANGIKGAAGFGAAMSDLFRSFPDIQWQVKSLLADGDQVAVQWIWTGTHLGAFQHIPPTGKKVTATGTIHYQLKAGKIIHLDLLTDRLGFLQQLEALPADLTTLRKHPLQQTGVKFIDKFFVPAAGKTAFLQRLHFNRHFIKTLPGFIEDAAYSYTDEQGNFTCITVASWDNITSLTQAKEAVQAEYRKQGFDLAAMLEQLHIVADRGVYQVMEN